jgi:hypothetical protein
VEKTRTMGIGFVAWLLCWIEGRMASWSSQLRVWWLAWSPASERMVQSGDGLTSHGLWLSNDDRAPAACSKRGCHASKTTEPQKCHVS